MEKMLETLLDSNWIFGLLSTIVGIYIFLMSLPAIIFQFSINSELRHVYFERFNSIDRIRRSFTFFAFLVVLFILILSNPGIKYYIQNTKEYNEEQKISFLYIYYFVTLMAFIFFFIASNFQVNRWIFKKSLFQELIESICKQVDEDYKRTLEINNKVISQMRSIVKVASDSNDKTVCYFGIQSILTKISQDKNYQDGQLNLFIEEVILNGILTNPNIKNNAELKRIVDLLQLVEGLLHESHNNVDIRALRNTYLSIAKQAIDIQAYELLNKTTDRIFSLKDSYEAMLQIAKIQIDNRLSQDVAAKATRYLNKYQRSEDENEKMASMRIAVILYAWLYNLENSQVKLFVKTKLKLPSGELVISNTELERVKTSHFNFGDFFTAECVDNLIGSIYKKETEQTNDKAAKPPS